MRTGFLITGIVLLLLANLLAITAFRGPRVTREGFAASFLENAASTGDAYQAMGPFDNVRVSSGNSVSE